jgi:hypothetical protein
LSIEALYIEDISFKSVEWIQKEVIMHPPINIQVKFNEFIKKMLIYKTQHLKAFLKISYQ